MDSLSQEILDLIIPHLYKDPSPDALPWDQPARNIHPYATISRRWQYAVERVTFAEIHKSSTDLPIFRQIFACSRRRELLRRLSYEIALPTYSENRVFCFESRRESRENQEMFQQGLLDIYRELAVWETGGMSLTLQAASPMDGGRRPTDMPNGLGHERWFFNDIYLTLDRAVSLPILSCVNKLVISNAGRGIHPAAIGQIIASIPYLEHLRMEINAPKIKHREMLREHWKALAAALESPSLANLKSLNIYLEQCIPKNHSFEYSVNDPSYPDGDVLSLAIRKLAERSHLRDLTLTGSWLISPALFNGQATFPYLERVKIEGSLITYDGRWLYTGDPAAVSRYSPGRDAYSDDDDDSSDSDYSINSEYHDSINEDREDLLNGNAPDHRWRTQPDPETFNPLMKSIAAAVIRMPRLRSMYVSIGQSGIDDSSIVAECLEAGERAEWFQEVAEEERMGRWYVTLMPEVQWDVPDYIRDLWREFVGEEGKIAVAHF